MTAPEPTLPDLHRECEPCDGHGIMTAPAWLAYDATYQQAKQEWQAANPDRNWYGSAEHKRLDEGYPDECEVPCRACDGTGYQVTKAGKALLYFLTVHGGKR